MIIIPINRLVKAMNTARISAERIKLKPRGNCREKVSTSPLITLGRIFKAEIKLADAIARAEKFLNLSETRPKSGSKNAPITGRKIIKKNKDCSLIGNSKKNTLARKDSRADK